MPRGIVFEKDRYLDTVKIPNFNNSIRDKLTNLVSNPFKSLSDTFNSINKSYRPIIFLATLALSTWATSAVVRTGINFLTSGTNPYLCSTGVTGFLFDCQNVTTSPFSQISSIWSKFNMSLLSKEHFLANGTTGLWGLVIAIPFYISVKLLTKGSVSFPDESVSARQLGKQIGIGWNLTPTFFQKALGFFIRNQLIYGVSDAVSQIPFEDVTLNVPTTDKKIKVTTLIAGLATFYFGGAYDTLKSYL
ncbi:MAG: hypothetical protein K940chlam1_00577 [Candidatus Anoxychlamydiales bacterium]|nr:hypothetical protein [Candidatus Anoxychlamydiales bacterium]NGX36507.1 hypothetical protein [Candidatus Anoxychlamydiales bacterium]